jgi:hypothetical protein
MKLTNYLNEKRDACDTPSFSQKLNTSTGEKYE